MILFAPLVFIAHFLEEAPGFVAWFNAHVSRGITQPLFWRVNIAALAITLVVVAAEWFGRSVFTAALVVAWFSFLMLANALLHVTAAISDRSYVPGLLTAVVLYLPFYALVVNSIIRSRRLAPSAVSGVAVVGAIPMLIHGYLIVFRGIRLF
jgi:hypothetical protein